MSSRKCPKCGKRYSSTYRKCPYCSGQEREKPAEVPVTRQIVSILRHRNSRFFVASSLVLILIAMLGMLMTRCSQPKEPDTPPPTTQTQPKPAKPLTLSQHTVTIYPDETVELVPSGNFDTLTWTSSDEAVASVNLGTITGKAPGIAVITASTGTESVACEVTVQEKPAPAKTFELVLSSTDFTIRPGDPTPVQMLERIKGTRDVYEGEVVWSSQDEKVVTVSETGQVERVGRGTTTITAEADGQVLECIVRVS